LENQNQDDSESSSDEEEEVIKNAISAKGKFASFLYMRNNMFDPQKPHRVDRALTKSSIILSRTFTKAHDEEDLLLMVNPKNMNALKANDLEIRKSFINSGIDSNDPHEKLLDFKPKSSLTPFLLLIALSLHGFFEGIALGIQSEFNGVLFLAAAILSHKWAEAFTLVNIYNII
jgi:zinc transporter ZupT